MNEVAEAQVLSEGHADRRQSPRSTRPSAPCRRAVDRSNSLTSGHRACQGCGEALGARYAIDAAMRATQRQAHRRQRDRLSRSVHDALSRDVVADAVDAFAVRQRRRGRDRRRRGDARRPGAKRARRRAGRRRRHHRHRLRLPFRHVRAQRRRALHLLRQRRLHEHRRAALLRDAARPRAPRRRRRMGAEPGNVFGTGKFMPKIAVAHEIPYVATASVADLHDLEAKVTKAMGIRRRALHPDQRALPARLGRGVARYDQARAARDRDRAVSDLRGGDGHVTHVRKIRRKMPVLEYLKLQRRFAHLFKATANRSARRAAAGDRGPPIEEYGLCVEGRLRV